jgi:hypothetical protein
MGRSEMASKEQGNPLWDSDLSLFLAIRRIRPDRRICDSAAEPLDRSDAKSSHLPTSVEAAG